MNFLNEKVLGRIQELKSSGHNAHKIFKQLQSEFGPDAPVYATVNRHFKDCIPAGEKTLSKVLSAGPILVPKIDYSSPNKHLNHRKLVYEDLSRTPGNVLALTSEQMLDVPAALEAGISTSRMYLVGNELTPEHIGKTSAHIILAPHLNIACNTAAYDLGITFTGANLDLTCALNSGMINMLRMAGAAGCWDPDAVISINMPNTHIPIPYAQAKQDLADNEDFCRLFAEVFNVGMPMSYIKPVVATLLPALCGMYAFCQGVRKYPRPFGHKYNMYVSPTRTPMGWVTFQLGNTLDDSGAKFGASLQRLISL